MAKKSKNIAPRKRLNSPPRKTKRSILNPVCRSDQSTFPPDRFNPSWTHSPLGVFTVDSTGRCSYFNPSCQDICDFEFSGNRGKSWPALIGLLNPEEILKDWAALTRKKREYSRVFPCTRRGTAQWIHVRFIPLFSDRAACEYLGTIEDITERLKAHEALEGSEAFNRRILSSSPDCIKVLDLHGRLIYMNLPGQQLLEIDDVQKLLRSRWVSFWDNPGRVLAKGALLEAGRGGEGRFEGFRPTMTGIPKWWDVMVTGIFDSEGKLVNFLVISRDVTARKVAADELIAAKNELRTYAARLEGKVRERTEKLMLANRKQKFLSARLVEAQEAERRRIARELHDEFGQQLTGLKLLLEHYAEAPTKPSSTAWAEGQAIIVNLLKLSQELALDLRPQVVDRLGLKVGVEWYLRRYQARTGIKVDFNCKGFREEAVPIKLKMTSFRLIQEALTNVARHASVKSASVQISNSPRKLNLRIVDRGNGFDRQKVLDKMTTGLSVMDERVNMAGGSLFLKTSPRLGTEVAVELPLKGYAYRRPG